MRQSDCELRVARHSPVLVQLVGDNFSIACQLPAFDGKARIFRPSKRSRSRRSRSVSAVKAVPSRWEVSSGGPTNVKAAPSRWEVSSGGPTNPVAVFGRESQAPGFGTR